MRDDRAASQRAGLVDGVALHEDTLGALGQRAASERPFEIAKFGEPAQNESIELCQSSTSSSEMFP
jgi:hypothetical protein